jgi:pimeloyl-ACP methyl ester carboxylesterase
VTALAWILGGGVALLAGGALFQIIGAAFDRRRIPPLGRLVGKPGRRLHAVEQGNGEPTIILESGIATSSLNWRAVQAELAKLTRVISYDRAGFGWSDPAQTPRTVANLVSDLESLVETLPVNGPILLVAHSFGSLIAREFSYRYPGRVVALVLLDPIDCEHWRSLPEEGRGRPALGARFSRRGVWLAHLGIVRFALLLLIAGGRMLPKAIARAASGKAEDVISRVTAEVGKMPPDVWPAVRAHWSRPQSFATLAQYLSQLTSCVHEIPYRSLGDLPLIVITADSASESEFAEHRRLAALSTRGEHIVAERSSHWVHLDRPDVVIAVVERCLRARGKILSSPQLVNKIT